MELDKTYSNIRVAPEVLLGVTWWDFRCTKKNILKPGTPEIFRPKFRKQDFIAFVETFSTLARQKYLQNNKNSNYTD